MLGPIDLPRIKRLVVVGNVRHIHKSETRHLRSFAALN